jgi:hypothetical protein
VQYGGGELAVKSEFTYLGTLYMDEGGTREAVGRCIAKGRSAQYAIVRRCAAMNIHNVFLRCRLFDALVKPVMMFGAEIWGPCALLKCVLNKSASGPIHEMEALHKSFLRQCLGVRKNTSELVLMMELMRRPLWIDILLQVVRFWNRIMGRDDGDLVKAALCEGYDLALQDQARCSSWVKDLMRCLDRLGVHLRVRDCISVKEVEDKAYHMWLSRFGVLDSGLAVRDIPERDRRNFKVLTYLRWFATDDPVYERFWFHLHRADMVKVVAQYRMGSHWLDIETGRLNGIPRYQRVCRCCGSEREDEAHLLVCPVYEELRIDYNVVGEDDDSVESRMVHFMTPHEDVGAYWYRTAGFLLQAKRARDVFITEFFFDE